MPDEFDQYKVKSGTPPADEFAQYKVQSQTRPDLSQNPPGVQAPIPQELQGQSDLTRGRQLASQAYGGNATGVDYRYSSDPNDPQPHAGGPTPPATTASNAALAGSTLTAPLTGGYGLLTRLGLMGAGAGAGSAAGQLATTGTVNPQQTAGDITNYGVIPELAGTAIGKALSRYAHAQPPAQPAAESSPVSVGKTIKPTGGPDLSKLPPMNPGQSTTIASHGYDPETQRMVIQFKNGNVYEYKGVPKEIYDQFTDSESQGSFHAVNVKGRYATNRIGQVKPSAGAQVRKALSQ